MRPAAQRAPPLAQRQAVGQRLARVLVVGQRVDHVQPRRRGGELLEQPLRERPDDDRVDPALEVARDVGDRLAAAERGVRLQRDHVAAELADGDLERRARAQRRLLEQHRDVPAAERVGGRRLAARATGRPSPARRDRGSARGRRDRNRESTGSPCGVLRHGDRRVIAVTSHRHVRYSALMRTYSALRSHVQTVDDARAGAEVDRDGDLVVA